MEKPKAKKYYDIQAAVDFIQEQLKVKTDYVSFLAKNAYEAGQNVLVWLPEEGVGTPEQQAFTKALNKAFGKDARYKLWW